MITGKTSLSEAKAIRAARPRDRQVGIAAMVRSIQQTLRVEGYDVSTEVVQAAVDRVLKNHSK